ncbi:MAG TPA: glycoside hydrolase family 11 protein [Polyangiaceae bacterium]|nr:glycoside hydrolase family 11 protein [Polyangiaceae bacterium]
MRILSPQSYILGAILSVVGCSANGGDPILGQGGSVAPGGSGAGGAKTTGGTTGSASGGQTTGAGGFVSPTGGTVATGGIGSGGSSQTKGGNTGFPNTGGSGTGGFQANGGSGNSGGASGASGGKSNAGGFGNDGGKSNSGGFGNTGGVGNGGSGSGGRTFGNGGSGNGGSGNGGSGNGGSGNGGSGNGGKANSGGTTGAAGSGAGGMSSGGGVPTGSCSEGQKSFTNNATGTHCGYTYEYWKDNGTGTLTVKPDGFSVNWSNIGNLLGRKGLRPGGKSNVVTYESNYQPNGNSYLCVYGWTRSPLIEYYIVDSWGSWRPPGGQGLQGTVTCDGGTYDIYKTQRVNQPSIDGNTTFYQYWSVRQQKKTSGTITVGCHFDAWAAKGMNLGSFYEVSMTVEGYQSSGTADVKFSMK